MHYTLSVMRNALGAARIWAASGWWAVRLRRSSPASLQRRIDRVRRDDPYQMHTSAGYVVALIGAGQRHGLFVDDL